MPADLLIGEHVIAVHLAAICVDLLTIDLGDAATAFEVEAHAGKVGELFGAPWTLDILAHVDRRP